MVPRSPALADRRRSQLDHFWIASDDNSELWLSTDGNPANPDPTATVRFGEQTFDEMMIGYVNWVPTGARPVEASAPREAR